MITPVPWTKSKIGKHTEFVDVEPGVCTVWNTYDNAEDNANLICSLPDLFLAAQYALGVLLAPEIDQDHKAEAIDKLTRALALVQGEQS